MLPIGEWALAVWEKWVSHISLDRMVTHSVRRLKDTKKPWSKCYGPGAAFVLTCLRLQWKVHSAFVVTTDLGRTLDLRLDPPVVVLNQCMLAVQR